MKTPIYLMIFLSLAFTASSIYFLWNEGRLCFLFTAILGIILTVEFIKILKPNKVK